MTTLAAVLFALGCSDRRVRDPDVEEGAGGGAVAQRTAASKARADERFDVQGKLKPSGRHFSWLEVPAGFAERAGSTPASSAWEARDMPLAKVTEYLEARLAPSGVDLRANGVVYRQSKPTHTQLPLGPVTATVLEIDAKTRAVRLLLDDLTPPREPPLPEKTAERELARERSRME